MRLVVALCCFAAAGLFLQIARSRTRPGDYRFAAGAAAVAGVAVLASILIQGEA